jgi:hypothetical protein
MPQPTPSDVHVNAPLTNIAIAYMADQTDYVADKMFPNVPVRKQSDVYFKYPRDNWYRTEAKPRAPSTESAGSGYAVETDSYNASVQALHKDVDDQLRANQDAPLNMDRDAAEFVTRGLMLRKEKDWAAKYFKTSTWTGGTGGVDFVPATKWDASGSTPITDIRSQIGEVKSKTGFRPNKLLLAEDVWLILQDNADFLDRIAITQRKIVTKELLASVLDVGEVLVAGGIENTAAEGAALAMDWLFKKQALLVYAAPRPSIMMPSAGYVFSWTGYLGASQQGMRMKRFRMEPIASDRVEGEMAYDQKLVASDLGVFFDAVIS